MRFRYGLDVVHYVPYFEFVIYPERDARVLQRPGLISLLEEWGESRLLE